MFSTVCRKRSPHNSLPATATTDAALRIIYNQVAQVIDGSGVGSGDNADS